MAIKNTRDLRKFLADVMEEVRSGSVTPTQAQAIAKLSAQINQSIAVEINAKMSAQKMGGDANKVMLLTDERPDDSDLPPEVVAELSPEKRAEIAAAKEAPLGSLLCPACEDEVDAGERASCQAEDCPFMEPTE